MRDLLYKELKLSINRFFYLLPLMLGLLFFIPQWFFTLTFMYFFWITVPQVYGSYLAQQDYNFISMLPVSRKDVVASKAMALVVIQLLHILIAVVFSFIHNKLYGVWNFSLDPNIAFIGVGFFMYGLFNISFLPYYFKTGYFFGKPVILGTVVTLVYATIIEFGTIKYEFMRKIFEGDTLSQLLVLIVGMTGFVLLSYFGIKISQKRYESIDR